MTFLLPKVDVNPFLMGYAVETDVAPALGPKLASFCQLQIGVLQLIVELGCVNMYT